MSSGVVGKRLPLEFPHPIQEDTMKKLIAIALLGIILLTACTPAAMPTKIPAPPIPISEELIVVGRLARISSPPSCGYIHFGAVAEYTDLIVIEGKYAGGTIYVVHGCPELPRNEYAEDSGNLKSFQVGDYHLLRLHLTRDEPEKGMKVFSEGLELPKDATLYFCSQVDLYSP